jgi:hypothetical protein
LKLKSYIHPPPSSIAKVGYIKKYVISSYKPTGQKKKIPIFYTYKDIKFDIEGWANSKKFLPEDFDLVLLRLKREKIIPGWIIGMKWTGLRLKKDDEVMFWKKNEEEREI